MVAEEVLQLPVKKIKKIINDPVKTAAAALIYVSDTTPGIVRVKIGRDLRTLKEKVR